MNDLEAAAEHAILTAQIRSFMAWVGSGRKLTQTGRIGLVDARHLVELLGTGDTIDSGGFSGYQSLKEILADPSSEEYEEMRTWAESQIRTTFDPASFDLAEASARVSAA